MPSGNYLVDRHEDEDRPEVVEPTHECNIYCGCQACVTWRIEVHNG